MCLAFFSFFSRFHLTLLSPPSLSLFALPKLPSTGFTNKMGKNIRARETLRQALPPLRKTGFHTTSNAVHSLFYRGELHQWRNFCEDTRATVDSQQWSNKIIGCNLKTRNLEENKVYVGDESGLQGRFQQAIGQTLGKVFEAQDLDIQFADFKCLPRQGKKVPDCVMRTSTDELKAVGDLKVPWVSYHRMEDFHDPFAPESKFRALIAQVLRYMKEMECMYGFLSSYDETIFFRQRHNGTTWVVDCSPVIPASNVSTKGSPVVTVRECFFHMAVLAYRQGSVDNQLSPRSWVEGRMDTT
ncbi:unnamed protein product [Penicillium salamii]|uniref:Uncharacterized protein n=1 Tax=Penicillium salamii TaxID=1612424 RepID=A0A9W4JM81_9EURO|nr:unnamed protein product [Penicillium salamii]CAG8301859.1 unnamed protein product [Penicillium salamii]CAG8354327.1 unnamed protein product [Penicillium salamii]CAG8360064.1 unnamed protein product [Penicillium salamii]CAG8367522.1 unnamed protein product [Penicillium salamii]